MKVEVSDIEFEDYYGDFQLRYVGIFLEFENGSTIKSKKSFKNSRPTRTKRIDRLFESNTMSYSTGKK